MTTPKESLEFYADPKNWKGGSILDMEASHFDGWTKAQQALASLQGEDAVERVVDAMGCLRLNWRGHDDCTIDDASMREAARAILASLEGDN